MSKLRLLKEVPLNVKKNDIQFNFADVQTKNPRLQGKTPLYLYTRDPLTQNLRTTKRWWESDSEKSNEKT